MSIGMALAGLATIIAAAHPRGAKRLMGFAGTQQEHIDRANRLMRIYKEKHDRKINPTASIRYTFFTVSEDQADAIWETMQKMKKNIR